MQVELSGSLHRTGNAASAIVIAGEFFYFIAFFKKNLISIGNSFSLITDLQLTIN